MLTMTVCRSWEAKGRDQGDEGGGLGTRRRTEEYQDARYLFGGINYRDGEEGLGRGEIMGGEIGGNQ